MARRDTHDIIVIGASMGGVEALKGLVARFPKDLPATVFVVLHLPSGFRSLLPEILSRSGPVSAIHPKDGEPLRPGCIYVAPSDRHLLVEPGRVRVVKGPRENNHRPAVDPLFRSAALAYGARVVGVVLTGALNCGTSGLISIKAQGGVAVVQDPADAYCGDMPRSALEYVAADYCVPLAELGGLLDRLARTPIDSRKRRPSQLLEQEVGSQLAALDAVNKAPSSGSPSHFSCPDCGGVLFELSEEGLLRFRCRVGHDYTGAALASGQQHTVDSALWAAARALEEKAALARRMAAGARERQLSFSLPRFEAQAREAEQQALLVRQVAMG
ncbi:chemotaxis protein CheB, partial [Hyalangium sp.]|uniref:chemotaxis protein CheB n=1 Tax=Hyalangium sp. TaxID=2028555 RepID=UPI002D2B41E1